MEPCAWCGKPTNILEDSETTCGSGGHVLCSQLCATKYWADYLRAEDCLPFNAQIAIEEMEADFPEPAPLPTFFDDD